MNQATNSRYMSVEGNIEDGWEIVSEGGRITEGRPDGGQAGVVTRSRKTERGVNSGQPTRSTTAFSCRRGHGTDTNTTRKNDGWALAAKNG